MATCRLASSVSPVVMAALEQEAEQQQDRSHTSASNEVTSEAHLMLLHFASSRVGTETDR